jgi:hypothetical protein
VLGGLKKRHRAHPLIRPCAGQLSVIACFRKLPACRLLPYRANRLANIAGGIVTVLNGFLTLVLPLTNG